jgi:amino acid transporter
MLLFLKLIDYLLAAIFISAAIVIYFDSSNQQYVIAGVGALAVAIFLFLLNRNSVNTARKEAQKAELAKKAELYTSLLQIVIPWITIQFSQPELKL